MSLVLYVLSFNHSYAFFNSTSSYKLYHAKKLFPNLAIILTPQSIAQNILQDIFLFHKFLVPHLLLHIDNAMAHSLSL